MSEKITASNLDAVVCQNQLIHDDIQNKTLQIRTVINTLQVSSAPQLALQLLRQRGLIQVPVDDPHFGGAIYVKGEKLVPFLNTALPRANQYFTAWHEVYHLYFDEVSFDHFIGTDNIMEERKADYFSSLMLLGNLMPYFNGLTEMNFVSKVFYCMDTFQAPYKAVLISLYESAKANGNESVMKAVKEHFDEQFVDMASRFRDLGLDDTLVTPSNILNLTRLSSKIQQAQKESPELTYHADNERFLKNTIKEISLIAGDSDV